MPVKDCAQCCDELTSMLEDQSYPQEILDLAAELSKKIDEYQKENPENVPSIRLTKDSKEAPEGEVETEESDDTEEMSLDDHKKMLKKKSIMITLD